MSRIEMMRVTKKKYIQRAVALIVMAALFFTSAISVAAFSRSVCIIDGSKKVVVSTMNSDTESILAQADIQVSDDDLIIRNDYAEPCAEIIIYRAFNVSITCDGETYTKVFNRGDVEDALFRFGITIDINDQVEPSLTTELTPDMHIEVIRWHTVNLNADGESLVVEVPEGTVEEALKYLNVELAKHDEINVNMTDLVKTGMEINIDRIYYEDKVTTEVIPYTIEATDTLSLYEGETEVTQEGSNGERKIVTRYKYVNGEVVETKLISNEVTREPVAEEKLVGVRTKANFTVQASNGVLRDADGNLVSYSKVITGSCTAYTAEPGAITSTGQVARYGLVAVNPEIIPYGTRLYICNDYGFVYGYAVAADTGGALMANTALVDLYYDSVDVCWQFGRRDLNVYILD